MTASPTLVLLVHGTGVTNDNRSPPQWWKSDSAFSMKLQQRLGKDFSIAGAGNPDQDFFTWYPGPNSETARRAAGVQLFKVVQDLEAKKQKYHLIGRSHGGSVIWYALRLAASKRRRLKGLQRWITVGTTFLEFQPSVTGQWDCLNHDVGARRVGKSNYNRK
jgi:hypothetical protein